MASKSTKKSGGRTRHIRHPNARTHARARGKTPQNPAPEPVNLQSSFPIPPTTKKRAVGDWKRVFLELYRTTGNVTKSAELTGVCRTHIYDAQKDDPEFAAAFDEAREALGDSLEAELLRRALDGVDKPIYFQGVRVDTIKEKSDRCLELALTAFRRDKFGGLKDRQAEARNNAPPRHITVELIGDDDDVGDDADTPDADPAAAPPVGGVE